MPQVPEGVATEVLPRAELRERREHGGEAFNQERRRATAMPRSHRIGSVGHTTETATRAGIEFDVYDTDTSGNLGGLFYAPGTTRFIVDRRRCVLLGCTITASEIADFLHAAMIAVAVEVPLERLRHAVPPFRRGARSGSRCSCRPACEPTSRRAWRWRGGTRGAARGAG